MSSLALKPSPTSSRILSLRTVAPVLASLLTLLMAAKIWWRNVQSLDFDDSYMFVRYARHLRAGDGIAWNPGGPHTFGLTSLPWLGVVTAGSFVTPDPVLLLVTLSVLVGIIALVFLAWSVSRRAISPLLRNMWVTFPLIGLPLVANEHFNISFGSGMETMLALLLVAIFVDQTMALARSPGTITAVRLAFITALATLTRPEALLPLGLAVALAAVLLLPSHKRLRTFLTFAVPLTAMLGATLLWNNWYFGSPLPLAFYIKSVHGYSGMRLYMNPFGYTAFFLAMSSIPLLLIAAFAQRQDWRLLTVFLLPVLAVILYLFGVLQIMGWGARYYLPYLPFLIVPALTILDRRLATASASHRLAIPPRQLLIVAAVLFATSLQFASRFYIPLGRMVAKHHLVYAPPQFTTANPLSLPPLGGSVELDGFANFAGTLPAGTYLAATEVGIVGVKAERVRILDVAGLNNDVLARHGYSNDYLFSERPDVIWLPHTDYTAMVGKLVTDPRLLRDYDVYPTAFRLGVAIRRDSPFFHQIDMQFRKSFAATYHGLNPDDFRATAVSWHPAPTPCQEVYQ